VCNPVTSCGRNIGLVRGECYTEERPTWGESGLIRVRPVSTRRGAGRDTYLRSPCPIARHPLAIDSVLVIGVTVDLPRGEIPFSFKDRVEEKSLYAFQRISVE
jgi:hypothetical protein